MVVRGLRRRYDDHDDDDHQAEDRRAWSELGKFLLLIAFVILVFLLGRAMVHHHFFTCGAQDNQSTGGPTGP